MIMRSITLFIVIGVALVFSLSAAGPAQAQPNGSYLQTCRNVSVAGKYRPDALLTAQCQTKKGSWRESSLYYKGCRGDIYNDNGTLRCSGGQAGNPGSLPPGSWRASCRNAFVDGGTLHAECRAISGRWIDARLNMGACPWGPVANDNGRLVCGGGQGGNFTTLILYEDFNFSGRTLQLTGPAPDLRYYNFDRRTSSLRVQGSWYVCSGINYTGECTKVAGAFNANGKWNDRISSARPY
jgi:beta/gamma crystallin/CVNH domain-containing protein